MVLRHAICPLCMLEGTQCSSRKRKQKIFFFANVRFGILRFKFDITSEKLKLFFNNIPCFFEFAFQSYVVIHFLCWKCVIYIYGFYLLALLFVVVFVGISNEMVCKLREKQRYYVA